VPDFIVTEPIWTARSAGPGVSEGNYVPYDIGKMSISSYVDAGTDVSQISLFSQCCLGIVNYQKVFINGYEHTQDKFELSSYWKILLESM
jgi:hypothetical protein